MALGNLPNARSATGGGVEAIPVVLVGSDGNPTYGGGGGGGGGDASAANQVTGNTSLSSIDTKFPAKGAAASGASLPVVIASDQALVPVNPLGQPGAARSVVANASSGASTNQALTAAVRRISMVATGSALRYAIGTGAQTAAATSHYIQMGERLDLNVPANAQIAVLSDTTTAGKLEITELT